MTITSAVSASWYDDVPPPAPKTVARPTTLGACQVRLQESMLLVPITWRANFCAKKFISFVAFEHEKIPNERVVWVARARLRPSAAQLSASSHEAGHNFPPRRMRGVVSRVRLRIFLPRFERICSVVRRRRCPCADIYAVRVKLYRTLLRRSAAHERFQ